MAAVLRAAVTSGTLYAVGNIIDQTLVQKRFRPLQPSQTSATTTPAAAMAAALEQLDTRQTAKFAVIGACLHGPYFLAGFRFLDWALGTGRTFPTIVAKAILGQVAVSPPFIAMFLGLSAVLDGKDPVARIKEKFLAINISSCLIWPFLSIVNFRWVPVNRRILFINIAGIFWNTYLSFETNARKAHVQLERQLQLQSQGKR
ncbi:hypothetical protein HK105_203095 [Polyrhizophydium stewartii]|uniref:Uncharacterized protein n=1 Tax=Polyrhizophydium stewartii TaxID=2732419 RepID=A0ABR4ND70_9FUNG|nr:Protein required for ethanol metabolism [Polyrhizophydium stewartii]